MLNLSSWCKKELNIKNKFKKGGLFMPLLKEVRDVKTKILSTKNKKEFYEKIEDIDFNDIDVKKNSLKGLKEKLENLSNTFNECLEIMDSYDEFASYEHLKNLSAFIERFCKEKNAKIFLQMCSKCVGHLRFMSELKFKKIQEINNPMNHKPTLKKFKSLAGELAETTSDFMSHGNEMMRKSNEEVLIIENSIRSFINSKGESIGDLWSSLLDPDPKNKNYIFLALWSLPEYKWCEIKKKIDKNKIKVKSVKFDEKNKKLLSKAARIIKREIVGINFSMKNKLSAALNSLIRFCSK